MKFIKNALLWLLTLFMAFVVCMYFPSIASIFAIAFILLVIPISSIRELFYNLGIKGWARGILIAICFIACFSNVPDSSVEPVTTLQTTEESQETSAKIIETDTETTQASTVDVSIQETTAPDTTAETVPETVKDVEKIGASTIATLTESLISQNYVNYEVSYDESSVTVSIWEDGIAMGATLAKAGHVETLEQWDYMVESLKQLSEAISELPMSLGRDDVLVFLNVLNDEDHDLTLLSILNGVVIYNSVTD